MNLLEPYHYKECGLDNVYLYNVSLVEDVKGDEVICIPQVNKLHKVIALGIVTKKGAISAKEIRFLRTLMGFKQSDFSFLLGKESQACGRWEREDNKPDKTTDMLIRVISIQNLELIKYIDVEHISKLANEEEVKTANINIDGYKCDYQLMDLSA